MDLLLNEESLTGQYDSVESFVMVLRDNILPCLELAKDVNLYFLLKSYNSFDLPVTKDDTIRSVLKYKQNTVVQKILSNYAKYFLKGPYWEDSTKTPLEITPNCKTEAFFRNGILLSFVPSPNNEEKHLIFSCNGDNKEVCNATNVNQFLECLAEKNVYTLECNFVLSGSDKVFMIHTGQSEDAHKEPHFHIRTNDRTWETTVSLRSFDLLVKRQFYNEQLAFFRKDIKQSQTEINRRKLIRLWNYFHQDKQIKQY